MSNFWGAVQHFDTTSQEFNALKRRAVSYLETVQLQGYGYLLLGQEKFRVPKIDRQNEELD